MRPLALLATLLALACAQDPAGTTSSPTTTAAASTSSTDSTTTTSTTTTGNVTTSSPGHVPATSTTTTDPSSTTGTTGTTGAPDPDPVATLITDDNRAYVEMHGGWGPHLRGLMRAADDALWFTVDAGEDVLHNREIRYYRRGAGEPAWTLVTSQQHTEVVQQNAGSILLGDLVYTYGVNVQQSFLEECYLDIIDPASHACNAVTIGGPYNTPSNSNYVGAAVLGDGARVVWFTVVGQNGGPGQFIYTYNYGGGWNGPVVGGIADGGNDLGYVHAMATANGELAVVGQAYFGAYPNGSYGAVVADITPGQVPTFMLLGTPDPAAVVRSSADLHLDVASGAAHVLAYFDGAVAYYHRPGGAAWSDHLTPLHVFADTYRARFVNPAGGPLWLVRGSSSDQGVTLHRADVGDLAAAVDWQDAPTFSVPAPAPGFLAPAAIYVESPTYQRTPVGGLNFALCGGYGLADRQIFHLHDAAGR